MTDSRPEIVILIPQHVYARVISPEAEQVLHAFADVTRAESWEHLSETDAEALFRDVDGVLTSWGIHPFPAKGFLASRRVKILSHAAGGVRWAPREALERGVVVTNASEAMAPRVAEMCLAFALMGLHNVLELTEPPVRRIFSEGGFQRAGLYGKTVGLVGFGWIARNLARLLTPFGVRLLAFDPYVSGEVMAQYGVLPVDLEQIFRESRVISIHAGATDETRGMIGDELLNLIQDSAVFINTARGSVVDHDALTAELRKRRFLAFLDVTDPEPLRDDHELRSLPNVILTGHRAGATDEPIFEVGDAAIGDLKRFFAGEPLLHEVKLEWYDRMT
ncbi:MAG: hydroxyacid dehydrogenase [Armatimonadota bacterium]|nr:hydroxyacid dehydrogenase [Armatimonadota bacterium]